MNKNVQLSIIVPVFNAEDYLSECLSSLVDQGFLENQYEVICIDDGSTDNSNTILKEYASRYEQIILLHQENRGVSAARNLGLTVANGDYVSFVDADDVPCRQIYCQLIDQCKNNNPDILYFDYYQGNAFYEQINNSDEDRLSFITSPRALTCVWREIIKRALIVKHGLKFDDALSIGEDLWFNEQLMCYVTTVYHYKRKCYFYRNHESNWQSNSKEATKRKMEGMIRIAILCDEFLNKNSQIDICHANNILDRKNDCIASAMIYSLLLPDINIKTLTHRLSVQGLYPYKIRRKPTTKQWNKEYVLKKILCHDFIARLLKRYMMLKLT